MFEDELTCSFVLGSPAPGFGGEGDGRRDTPAWREALRVDIRPVKWDAEGGGLQAQPSGIPWRYPQSGFKVKGLLAGRTVRCLSAEVQVLCHDGYDIDDEDIRDMHLLRDRLGADLPPRFDRSS